MSELGQNNNNMFSILRNNYTCISDEQARQLANMITENNEIKSSGSKYSGTSFDLYNSDGYIAKTNSNNNFSNKKKLSELDAIIDEDTLPIKLEKTLFDKFADWLSGFEIPDDTPELTLEDMGFENREITLGWNKESEMTCFSDMISSAEEEEQYY